MNVSATTSSMTKRNKFTGMESIQWLHIQLSPHVIHTMAVNISILN